MCQNTTASLWKAARSARICETHPLSHHVFTMKVDPRCAHTKNKLFSCKKFLQQKVTAVDANAYGLLA